MKILVTTHNSNGSSRPIATTMSADTALTRSDKPLFLPTHIAAGFSATPAIAWQVGRVGKCIARRFAWRYCHAVAPAMLVTARDFKLADAVLFVSYLAIAGAICALIWSAVRNAIKK